MGGREARGRASRAALIVAVATALIGYTFMTLSTGVPVDSEDLHRFVRRQLAIYSVRGRASADVNPTPARGH